MKKKIGEKVTNDTGLDFFDGMVFNEYAIFCDFCGEEINPKDGLMYEINDKTHYCDSDHAFEDGWRFCDGCDRDFRYNEEIITEDGQRFCSDTCAKNYGYQEIDDEIEGRIWQKLVS